MPHRNCLVTVLALSALGLATAASSQEALVSPAELQSQWVGKTVVARIGSGPATGFTILLNLAADGSATLGGSMQDTGTWRLTDKGYCATWKYIRGGAEGCFTVVKRGDTAQVLNRDGSLNSTVVEVR